MSGYIKKENWVQHVPSELHTSIKGAISELEACTYFLKQGYEVFRNVSPVGKVDIIIWKVGEDPILIDVKTSSGFSKTKNVVTMTKKGEDFVIREKIK